MAPLGSADFIVRNVKNLARSRPVDIDPVFKSLQQPVVVRKMGHDPQFDLGIVRGQKALPGRCDKRLADLPALGGADGDVLQIGVGR